MQKAARAESVGRPSRLSLALQVEGQLFTEENIFRFEGSSRTRPQQQELQSVLGQIEKYRNQAKQGMSCSHGAGSMPRVRWEEQLCVSCEFVTKFAVYGFFAEHRQLGLYNDYRLRRPWSLLKVQPAETVP